MCGEHLLPCRHTGQVLSTGGETLIPHHVKWKSATFVRRQGKVLCRAACHLIFHHKVSGIIEHSENMLNRFPIAGALPVKMHKK